MWLIRFGDKDGSNAAAGKNAFVVNRVGDFAVLLGMFMLFVTTSRLGHATLDVPALREMASESPEAFGSIATA